MRNLSGVKKGVILLSGGIDSAVTLYLAKSRGYRLQALIVDYGQRHKKEIEYAKKIATMNKVAYHYVKCDLSWAKSALVNKRLKVPCRIKSQNIPLTYVSGRNIIFLSYAASLAESIQANAVFIGAHIQDYSGYPDCRPEFLSSFEKALNLGLKEKGLKIVAPLLNKRKVDIIRTGLRLGVPFKHTWSCYRGEKFPCLKCDSCRFRMSAFAKLGLSDPSMENKGGNSVGRKGSGSFQKHSG